MKTIFALTFTSLLLNAFAAAESPVFTSLGHSGENVFAGVKSSAKGMEPETYLLKVKGDALSSEKIPLPTDLEHREVISILDTTAKDLVVVMTQRTVEQGDNPLLHSYDTKTKKWTKLGEVGCHSFSKLKIEASQLTVNCLVTNKSGDETESPVKVSLKGILLKPQQEIVLPVTKLSGPQIKAELLGESFEWKELKVVSNQKEKLFKP